MRVFVYELTCACASHAGLRTEGAAMLTALLADFASLPDVEPITLLAEDLPLPPCCRAVRSSDEISRFRELAVAADATLVIAPEFDDLLYQRCAWVEAAGGRLLGPSAQAVRLTGDKLILGRHLQAHGVRTPAVSLSDWPTVLKPRHGAGSQVTFLLRQDQDMAAAHAAARAEGWRGEMLLQKYVAGRAVSVAFLIGPSQIIPLLPAEQHLSTDGRFHYCGGALPLPPDLAARAVPLARQAIQAVPGLLGYVGVDLVLGAAADGSEDWVIEINPRLTTSYVGLRALAETNLAAALLHVCAGVPVHVRWKPGTVRFTADGTVTRPA